jgi:hypothetical protein
MALPDPLGELFTAVTGNCTVASARQSGFFSLCGLFLRLKDRYLWEHQLPPWSPIEREKLLSWIDDQERLWQGRSDATFQDLPFNGKTYPCFDSTALNRQLIPIGYYYGAGYGPGMTPTFFFSTIRERTRSFGYEVLVLEKDLACDLSFVPAQRQGRTIVIRLDPLRFFLWAMLQDTESREGVQVAMEHYRWSNRRSPRGQMNKIVAAEAETLLHHELGEALDRSLPPLLWRSLVASFPFSRIELYLRSLKDLLADTHPRGTLSHIIEKKKIGSLGFYLSNLKGLRRVLFPELIEAVKKVKNDGDWSALEHARLSGRKRFLSQAGLIREYHKRFLPHRPQAFSSAFEEAFLRPLGY